MGSAALFNNTGNFNTAAGSFALLMSTTGTNNIAIGACRRAQCDDGE